jgi:hypothetical protein
MRKFLIGGLVFGAMHAGPAVAADVPAMIPQSPVASGTFSWTSWYVGGFVGGAFTNNAETTVPCNLGPPSIGCRLAPSEAKSPRIICPVPSLAARLRATIIRSRALPSCLVWKPSLGLSALPDHPLFLQSARFPSLRISPRARPLATGTMRRRYGWDGHGIMCCSMARAASLFLPSSQRLPITEVLGQAQERRISLDGPLAVA